jgi:chromosome segregation ATPase
MKDAVDLLNQRIAELEAENERLRAMADGKFAEILEDAEKWRNRLATTNKRLREQNERLREALNTQFPGLVEISKDAERYRWGIENPRDFFEACQRSLFDGTSATTAIDAARGNDE